MPSPDKRPLPASVLRIAAGVSVLLGLGIIAWLADKAVRYPSIQATQRGYEAPLWPPFMLFVGIALAVITGLFLYAARRVERGEDLFGQRHRRRRSDRTEEEQDA